MNIRWPVFFLSSLLVSVVAWGQPPELLANSDFSRSADGRIADGWVDGSTALKEAAVFAIVAEGPEGRRVQRVILEPLAGGRFRLMQTLPAPAPGFYRLRATLRVAAAMEAELVLRTASEPRTGYGVMRETVPAGAWRELTGYARVPPRDDQVAFVILFNDPGTAWLASASLQVIDETFLSSTERERVARVLGPPLPVVDEARVVAETDARIQANRTAPLTVRATDAAGRPAAGVTVRVEHVRHLFEFGAGFDGGITQPDKTDSDRRHREAFLRIFNAATVHLSANEYDPKTGAYHAPEILAALDWLEAHGLRARVHPLFWNLMVPRWMDGTATSTDDVRAWMDRLLMQASKTMLTRAGGAVVFNEVVRWDRYLTPLTPAIASTGSGQAGSAEAGAIAVWLRRFKELNPKTAAVINDYDTTPEYYFLLKDVIDAGGPLDAVGMQSHMHNGTWSVTHLWNTLNRLALLGRPVFFTELSVPSGAPRAFNWRPADPPWETTPAGEAEQADYLEKFYRLVYSHPAAAGITYWDYSDRGTWLNCPVGLLRKDGSPKPAFEKLDRLINETWRTSGEFTTDRDGRVVIPNAFEGEYHISAGGQEVRGGHRAGQPLEAVVQAGSE